ncbi:transcriptional regulator [Sporolactobacillus shoreae]|uniref:Transcriptional regulator n=1 Tax=Sporolactobacillus shoreae TaxID=1465501 RepID=A0A4Z0GIU1_9BACL|nr:transcriptional regulator [Sporolactobacillus shoreae]TGA95737.1 transcriptional regulator [Sporolactobacillus shoreae]
MTEPRCPECGTTGLEHIVYEESVQSSPIGDPWFNVAFCDHCGHIYGVFAKTVHRPSSSIPPVPKHYYT